MLNILNETYTNGLNNIWLNVISVSSVFCGILVITTKNPIVSVLFLIGLFFSIASYLMMLGINFIGLSYLLVYVGAVSILFIFILMLINVRVSELTTDNNNSFFLAIITGILLFTSIYAKGNQSNWWNQLSLMYNKSNIKTVPFENQNIKSFLSPPTGEGKIGFHPMGEEYSQLIPIEKSITNKFQSGIIEDIIYSVYNIYNDSINNVSLATSHTWDGALAELSHISSIGSIIYTNYPLWLILTSIILLLAMVGTIIITIKK